MSGRSAKEALEKIKARAKKAAEVFKPKSDKVEDLPLGDGMLDSAGKALKSRRQRLDDAIDGGS